MSEAVRRSFIKEDFRFPLRRIYIRKFSYKRYDTHFFKYVRFEVFTEATLKSAVFCDVTPCGSCKDRRFGGKRASVAGANVVPSSPILVTLMMEAIPSSNFVSALLRSQVNNF
jgi:hypothetical protein